MFDVMTWDVTSVSYIAYFYIKVVGIISFWPKGARDGTERLRRPRQRGGRAAGRADRRRRRRADDPDAHPAVRGEAGRGHLQRPGRRRGHAAGRRGGPPAQGHGEPAAGRLDDARLG